MIRILATDGIDAAGKKIFQDAGFEVVTEKISQDQLKEGLKNFDAVLVRSATQVRKEHIDACPNLKLIGRAGVGMDNIDVAYARKRKVAVVGRSLENLVKVGSELGYLNVPQGLLIDINTIKNYSISS